MPLSEHEQRQLDQIEQALYADYPRFASAVRASDPRVHYKRRVVQAAFGFLIGIGLLLAGVITLYILIGVAGFVVMLGSSMWAVNSYRHMTGVTTTRPAMGRGASGRGAPGSGAPGSAAGSVAHGRCAPRSAPRRGRERRAKAAGPGFMERLEERWRRRQERDR